MKQIAIVEDEPLMREELETMLKRRDMRQWKYVILKQRRNICFSFPRI